MKANDRQPVACTNFKLRQLLRSVSRLYEARKHCKAAQQTLNQRLGQNLASRLSEMLDQSQQQLLDASSDST